MFWNKRKDRKKDNRPGAVKDGRDKQGGDREKGNNSRSSQMQKLFQEGCDSDFVFYDE